MGRLVFALLLAAYAAGEAAAQFPSRPVRLVVPASPGGASDLVARLLAPSLSPEFGQPFVVENRVTSGGIIATQQVADAAPDGHTLLVTFDTFAVNPFLYRDLKWDPLRDFAPVMQVCRYPQVLVVHPSLGVKTVPEFVALAKEKGASLNYGPDVLPPRKGEGREPELRLGGSRVLEPARLRALQGRGRHRHGADPLPRRRSGDAGPRLGPGAGAADPGRRRDRAARE